MAIIFGCRVVVNCNLFGSKTLQYLDLQYDVVEKYIPRVCVGSQKMSFRLGCYMSPHFLNFVSPNTNSRKALMYLGSY